MASRRAFLYGSGAALAGLSVASLLPSVAHRRRLLVVFLRGGADGLDTVIPHGDADYGPALRPTLHVPAAAAHDLNGFASLHPALAPLLPAYRAGELALVHRVGYKETPRSHLLARPLWEDWIERFAAATPGGSLETGGGALLDGARLATVTLPGWDTHAKQAELGGAGMAALATGLDTIRRRCRQAGIWDDTVVLTLSEFGRASRENSWGGTDHGAASCVLVAGGAVRGGVYGCDAGSWPAGVMFGAEGGALLPRTDPRAILAELLRDHLGASPDAVARALPGYAVARLRADEVGLLRRRWLA